MSRTNKFPTRCESILGRCDEGFFQRMEAFFERGSAIAFFGLSHIPQPVIIFQVFQDSSLAYVIGLKEFLRSAEMGFAKEVADEIIFMDQSRIVEKATDKASFENPKTARAKDFLNKILI